MTKRELVDRLIDLEIRIDKHFGKDFLLSDLLREVHEIILDIAAPEDEQINSDKN